MKGWTKDGTRVDLLPWQEKEIRAYMHWVDGSCNPPFSRFMYSDQAVRDPDQVLACTIDRMRDCHRKTKQGTGFPGRRT